MPNPIAFSIFGIDIRWYGVLIATGMILAAVITYVRAPRHGIERENILDIVLVSIPVGIIGARAYYVIFSWDYYGAHPDQILNFRGGGLAIHGGLIFGLLAAWFVCRHKKISFINALDLALPTVALAQAIGRWGNYFNGEAHGGPTNLPWAITVDGIKVHPTFLYESIWCIIIFAVLILIDNKPHFVGKGFLTRQDRGALQVTLYHNDDCFITGQLFNLTFQRFKPRKLASLFSSVSAYKLIPSVLFKPNGSRGHYAVSLNALDKLLHILVH